MRMTNENPKENAQKADEKAEVATKEAEKEIGGFKDAGLPEPTRYNDWEVKGRCSDF